MRLLKYITFWGEAFLKSSSIFVKFCKNKTLEYAVYMSSMYLFPCTVLYDDPDKALHTLPPNLEVKTSGIPDAGLGVWALADFPACTLFGPYAGEIIPNEQLTPSRSGEYAWQVLYRISLF